MSTSLVRRISSTSQGENSPSGWLARGQDARKETLGRLRKEGTGKKSEKEQIRRGFCPKRSKRNEPRCCRKVWKKKGGKFWESPGGSHESPKVF